MLSVLTVPARYLLLLCLLLSNTLYLAEPLLLVWRRLVEPLLSLVRARLAEPLCSQLLIRKPAHLVCGSNDRSDVGEKVDDVRKL